jgi:2-C-methyl-D-erythritol 4-phosphate cytidylyltransferase
MGYGMLRFSNRSYSNKQIFIVNPDDDKTTKEYIPRETLRRVSTPQAYQYQLVKSVYEKAFETGLGLKGSSYTNTMMVEHGIRLYFAKGSERNVKLTTKEDLDLFKAMLELKRDTWLK